MSQSFNKFDIRTLILNTINSINDETSDDEFESFNKLIVSAVNSFSNDAKKFVCELLLKELAIREGMQLDAIKFLLAEIATLENIEDAAWKMLYNPDLSDMQKERYLQLLRALGGKIDVNELMNCIDDIDAVVDEQAQNLLEIATVNPEAQIDFLDFLMSLPSTEQLILIKSLAEDFKGDEMANMLTPCLRIDLDKTVKQEILSIMGQIPSYLTVKPLKNYICSSGDEDLKRAALLTLNQIKASGIDIDDAKILNLRENEICRDTRFHKAFLSQVDGCGNQGLIFSRITDNGNIIMFSTVINCQDGIMDCFGLYHITENDFKKVITRFKANDTVVPVTAEVAKYLLNNAEKLSASSHSALPYEYTCWNVYTCDIEENPIDYNSLFIDDVEITEKTLYKLYDTGNYDSWFFEYDDNVEVRNFINHAVEIGLNAQNPMELLEDKIDDIFFKVYSKEKIRMYSNMLKMSAFIFYLNNNFEISNIAMNVSKSIEEGNTLFLKDILRRSVLQNLANIIAKDGEEQEYNLFVSHDDVLNISAEEAFNILKKYESNWDGVVYE